MVAGEEEEAALTIEVPLPEEAPMEEEEETGMAPLRPSDSRVTTGSTDREEEGWGEGQAMEAGWIEEGDAQVRTCMAWHGIESGRVRAGLHDLMPALQT